jgi:15-cis-phytoene desaturase
MQVNDSNGMDGTTPTPPRVLIAGGGLAGLAAAKTLVDAGVPVTLLESRAVLGGKASSWRDVDGDWIESGLHVFFGAYVEIFDLMRELGIYDHILWKEHVLTYTLVGGARFAFHTWDLPSPLHLLPAIAGNRYFTMAEKFTLARAMPRMLFSGEEYYRQQDQITYEEWHLKNGISKRMLQKMYLPMALALKFVPPAEISAKIVLDVTAMFLRQDGASRMGFLDGSPEKRLIAPLADYIRSKGGSIRTGAKVRELQQGADGLITGVRLANDEAIGADRVILALPIHQLNRLIPPAWRRDPYFERLGHFEGVPVITAQLWLDRQVTHVDNVLFSPDGIIPVYADLANTTPGYADNGHSRIEAVVAPARNLMDWDDQAIIDRVWDDVQRYFPRDTAGARIRKWSLVRIPQSVYWPKPGLDALRPVQRTPIANLYLAGGYTVQRFYDSMEGAVSSGRRAAAALLSDLRAPVVAAPLALRAAPSLTP